MGLYCIVRDVLSLSIAIKSGMGHLKHKRTLPFVQACPFAIFNTKQRTQKPIQSSTNLVAFNKDLYTKDYKIWLILVTLKSQYHEFYSCLK